MEGENSIERRRKNKTLHFCNVYYMSDSMLRLFPYVCALGALRTEATKSAGVRRGRMPPYPSLILMSGPIIK